MNNKLERTPLDFDGHPDENQLLLAIERELSPEDAAKIDRHLGSCWDCRAKSHEMQRGILAFVEYREKRYLPSLESPPREFGDFRRQLRLAAGETQHGSTIARIWNRLVARFTPPSTFRWAGATAALMVLVVIWMQVLSPPQLSANELLTRAKEFQNPKVAQSASPVPQKAHQRVRISDGRSPAVERDFEWNVGSETGAARWDVKSDPSQWNAPLTAEAFASWRDSVAIKKDEVSRSGNLWILDTTVTGDAIQKAWLVIRADDFHPVEQHILFADNRQLDFEELSFEIHPQEAAGQEVVAQQIAQNTTPIPPAAGGAPAASEASAGLNEAEVALRYLMFANKWDLDEDLQITRTGAQVVVEGTASSPGRAASMQAAFGALQNVRTAIAAPGLAPRSNAPATAVAKTTSQALVPLLRDVLDRSFAQGDERQAFIDDSLNASDTALSHAWAVRRLVDRYSEEEEATLSMESRAKLKEMLRAHLQQLRSANMGLDRLIALLPPSTVVDPNPPASWRAAILSLFTNVQRQDSLVAALVVGTQSGAQAKGQDVRNASQNLRTVNHAIHGLLESLEEGASAVK